MVVFHPGVKAFFDREQDAPEPVRVTRYFVSMLWADGHTADDLLSFEDFESALKRRDQLAEQFKDGYIVGRYRFFVASPLRLCNVACKTVNTVFKCREP